MNVYQPAPGAANNKVSLDLRGERISIERDSLMELPESVLLCLFPNGVVLSPQRQPRTEGLQEEDQGEDVYFVDVSNPAGRSPSDSSRTTPATPSARPFRLLPH